VFLPKSKPKSSSITFILPFNAPTTSTSMHPRTTKTTTTTSSSGGAISARLAAKTRLHLAPQWHQSDTGDAGDVSQEIFGVCNFSNCNFTYFVDLLMLPNQFFVFRGILPSSLRNEHVACVRRLLSTIYMTFGAGGGRKCLLHFDGYVYCLFMMYAHMKLSLIFVLRAKLPSSPRDEHGSCLRRLLASLPMSLGFEGHR